MQRFRPYVLPVAIVLGLLFHRFCGSIAFLVPYVIFTILLLTFAAVDLRRLRLTRLDVWLMLFQVVVSAACYVAVKMLFGNDIIAEGVLIGVLCPVASSVAVISCILGANRETVTTYTIVGNLMVAVVAPLAFTIVGEHPELTFMQSLLMIFAKIGTTLALPYFLALALQLLWPRGSAALARANIAGFYLWAVALFITLGQTINFIFLHGAGHWGSIAWLAALAALFCFVQFFVGRRLGIAYARRTHADTAATEALRIGAGQLLGQKNTGFGIWMANTFLNPLASVFLAFYCVFQNLFNAWQMANKVKS